jgi:hypothetical protein
MLEPHSDVKPVGDRPSVDPSVAQDRTQTWAAIGERCHHGLGGSANDLKAPADLNCDVCIGFCDGTEDLPPTIGRLDIADANFQVSFVIAAAADKGRISGDGDTRYGIRGLCRRRRAKLGTDFERVAA